MVQEFESRFCSDQQTILQVLDPIHRSLLISNSEFECIENTDNPLNQFPDQMCELFQQNLSQQQQPSQQEKQHRRQKSIENKNIYGASVSVSKKPDVTCVSDSNCLILLNKEFNMPDKSECMAPANEKEQNLIELPSKKNIQIRIVTNRKRSRGDNSRQMISSESQTDSWGDTDSDTESQSVGGNGDEYALHSELSTNTDEVSDYNDFPDFHTFESSSNDEATTTSTDSNAPMIQIVQEITKQRSVVSSVQVNKKKVKSFQKTRMDRVTISSKVKPQWKNRQRIIDDNVCNEILDETINCSSKVEEDQITVIESPSMTDVIVIGELKAKPKYSQKKMGKLMQRRLSRVHSDNVSQPSNQRNQSTMDIPLSTQLFQRAPVPPKKPPRTFASSSSKTSTDSIGANTATTLAIEDFHKSSQNTPQMSPGGGWIFDKMPATKPTCPTLDDINDFESAKRIGWVASMPKHREEFVHVLNMLNENHPMPSNIMSLNLMPEPQFQIPCKEDIDQVDSSVQPRPALRRSKKMSMEANHSISSSTPTKRTDNFSSHSLPISTRSDSEICKKCKLQIIQPSSARRSFGKGAIKRTKLFFQASKNIWNKPKANKQRMDTYDCSENEYYVDLDDNVNDTPTKMNLNSTVKFNTNDMIEKKTEKRLDLTPRQPENPNNIDSSRCILNKLLTSVKRTPPKKPIRQSLAHKDPTRSPSNNEEENFNFNRIVDSPKSKEREKSFKLSPRKLFFSTNEKPSDMQINSYRSFEADQRDDLKLCIVDYLRSMNDKIEHRQADQVECTTVPGWRSRIRNVSVSSDVIDYIPQRHRVVQIDCHPEPLYSEIVVQPTVSLNHIMVNDNPKAIYTTVNKTKNQNINAPVTVNVDEIRAVPDEAMYRSCNSLEELSLNNNLADSILNMLELMKQQKLDGASQPSEIDDVKPQSDHPCKPIAACVIDPSAQQLTQDERFQQSVFNATNEGIDDNSSVETFFTENLCDDVIRGDSVNNDIVSTFNQLENLVCAVSLVESETDDEIAEDLHETARDDRTDADKMFSDEDSPEYCTILEANVLKSLADVQSMKGSGNSLPSNSETKSSCNRKNVKLQSPLVAAPSMIEIPDQFMMKLTNQIAAQREIRNQLKQAIQICRTTKEFECSSELVEAERLMLLSAKKEACAKLELTRIDYEENGLTVSPAKCVGAVTIKKIEFDLKAEEMLEQIFQLSYICICSYRDQVVATHSKERTGNKVEFNDIGIKIGSLNSTFEIKIEIYVLRLPRPLRKYSHESKYHLNKISKKPLFSNPVKLFSNSSISHTKPTADTEESRFRLRGYSKISAKSLTSEKIEIVRNSSWPKNHVFISYNNKSLNLKINDKFTNMTGVLRTEFIYEISLNDSGLTGFLCVKEENGDTVREMWCRLIGCTLEYWNNDIDCLNGKAPIFSIDLIKCTNELFELIDDKFSIDIFNDEVIGKIVKNRISRYWISAQNRNDLILWLTELNRILKFIKDWNI